MRAIAPALLLVPLLCTQARANALDHLRTTDDIGLNKVPHTGISHILVVPSRINRDMTAQELERLHLLFATEGGTGSFREFWQVASGGRYDPIPTLADPVIYRTRCPIPGKTLGDCTFGLGDIGLIQSGGLKLVFQDLIGRVRDEQHLDLALFDVNTATGPGHDGYFDGVIVDTDMYSGIGFPLAAVGNTAVVPIFPPADGGVPDGGSVDAGPTLSCGIVALVPPDFHEYGHTLGFIDLYGGPNVNDLMFDAKSTLGAFSRQQIGWGDVVNITEAQELDLVPTLEGGPILRFGSGSQYILVENRGGPQHALYDGSHPGIYVYSVDESQLPTEPLGFLDIFNQSLYLPNASPPYLFMSLPVGCNMGTETNIGTCALSLENQGRELIHPGGTHIGFSIKRGASQSDGTIHLSIIAGSLPPPPDAGVVSPPVTTPDAGTSATTTPPAQTQGCLHCESADGGASVMLWLFLAHALRQRRHRER